MNQGTYPCMNHSFYSAKQLAELATCAHITVQKYIEKGKLRSFRKGTCGRSRTGMHIVLAEDAARFVSEYRMRRTQKRRRRGFGSILNQKNDRPSERLERSQQ